MSRVRGDESTFWAVGVESVAEGKDIDEAEPTDKEEEEKDGPESNTVQHARQG